MSSSWSALHARLLASVGRHDHHRHFRAIPGLAAFPDIPALLDHQHCPDGDPAAKRAVLRYLLIASGSRAAEPDTAQTLLLLALWPGLDAIHGRLLRYHRSDPDALAADLAAEILAQIGRADPERITCFAATLLRNTERDLRRAMTRDRRQDAHEAVDPDALTAAGLDPLDRLCAREVLAHLGADAPLAVAILVEGRTTREVAVASGLGVEAARKRLQRAVARVRRSFGVEASARSGNGPTPVPDHLRDRLLPCDDTGSPDVETEQRHG